MAIYESDKAVRKSQGAGAAKDLAAVQRGNGTVGALLKVTTMFYSYMSAFYQRQRSLGRDAGSAWSDRDAAALPGLMARAWWLFVVPPILSQLMAGRGPEDDEDWGLWSFKQMIFQMLGPIPLMRDVAQPAWNKAVGQAGFDYQFSPMQRAVETVFVTPFANAHKVATGGETKRATKDTLEGIGYTTGLVPGQIATATQFLVDIGYGEQDPQSAAEWYRGLTTGKAEPKS